MEKKCPIHFSFDDRSQRTREQLEAEGFVLHATETVRGRLHFPTQPSLTAGDAPSASAPATLGDVTLIHTPQLPTPYARLIQALWEHRLALTGTDVAAMAIALDVLSEHIDGELRRAYAVLPPLVFPARESIRVQGIFRGRSERPPLALEEE